MPSGLIDPLSIQPKDVEVVWTISPPKKHNGKGVLNKRIEDICTKEAAKHGYDKILIRSLPHNTTTLPGTKTYVQDEMHITVTFESKYFGTKRSVHIPVNIYNEETKKWEQYELDGPTRSANPNYPYRWLQMQGEPKYSKLDENPFPKTMRQRGIDRPSRQGTPAPQQQSASGPKSTRNTPSPPQSRPGSAHSNRPTTPQGASRIQTKKGSPSSKNTN